MTISNLDEVRKQSQLTYESIATAYHEAGHTLYGLLSFFNIKEVTIFQNKKTKRIEGLTYYSSVTPSHIKNKILKNFFVYSEICFRYAGPVSEKLFFEKISGSEKYPSILNDGSSNDINSASILIKEFNLAKDRKNKAALKAKLISQTKDELDLYWEDVTIIAHLLINNKLATYDEIKIALIEKSKNHIYWTSKFEKINYVYENFSTMSEKSLKQLLDI